MPKYQPSTHLIHQGRDDALSRGAVNIPPYRSSTILFPTLEDYNKAQAGTLEYSSYGIHGTPTTDALCNALMQLEGGDYCELSSSGMLSIANALLAFLKTGDHLLVVDTIYGPTRRFCKGTLRKMGIEVEYYDPSIGGDIRTLLRDNTRIVMVESPGSLTFEVQDVPAIAEEAHKKGAIVIGDNTWATPLHMKPFELGMDISIHSCTKYISGHADVLMGATIATKECADALRNSQLQLGICSNSDEAYLALRGLRTMGVRLKQHEATALKVAEWLQGRDEVTRILHPAFKDCPGHELFKRDFSGSNGLFAFLLNNSISEKAVAAMLDHMELCKMGYSWGGFESLLIPFTPRSIRTASSWQHDGPCLRLHCGLEDADDIIADLQAGFERMANAA